METLAKRTRQLPADRNPAAVYLSSLAESGRRGVLCQLRTVAELLGHQDPATVPWQALRYQHAQAVRTRLLEAGKAPATVNLALSAIKGVAKAAFNLELINADDYQRIRNVKPVRGERLPSGRALSQAEVGALLTACAEDEGDIGARDGAMIGLLYAAGLRRSELVALDREDFDEETGELRIDGKGSKQRNLWLDNGAFDALADWLHVRGGEAGPMFHPINKGGRITHKRLSSQTVLDVLRKRARQAKVKDFSPHDLRRTFISDQLDAGTDIVTVQAMAGHASPSTTARYDRRGDRAKQRAAKALHVPWRRRTNDEEGEQ